MSDSALGKPFPVRFEEDIEASINTLQDRTGFNFSEIIRRSARYTIPRFLTGEIDISRLPARGASIALLSASAPIESAPEPISEDGPVHLEPSLS